MSKYSRIFNRKALSMNPIDEMVYDLECDSCGMTYEVAVDETEKNEPVYCPFCGSDIDIEDEDEDFIHDIDDEYDELDFDDYRD